MIKRGNGFHLRIALCAVFSFAGLLACSPTAENSLLTNQATQPSTHSVSLTPTEDELYVKADSASFYNAAGKDRFDISGECFPSTFPTHFIYVYLNGAKQSIVDIAASAANQGTSAQCRQGRFNIAVITSGLGSGAYSMQVQIVGMDSSGSELINVSRGVSKFGVTKYAAAQ